MTLSRDQKSINGTNNNLTEKNHGVSKFLRSFLQHVLHVINFDERGETRPYLRTIILNILGNRPWRHWQDVCVTCCWICSASRSPRNLVPAISRTSNLGTQDTGTMVCPQGWNRSYPTLEVRLAAMSSRFLNASAYFTTLLKWNMKRDVFAKCVDIYPDTYRLFSSRAFSTCILEVMFLRT